MNAARSASDPPPLFHPPSQVRTVRGADQVYHPSNHNLKFSFVSDKCTLPAVAGPCNQGIERWYFDSASSQCKEFTYGGCHGNRNRFMTRELCESQCARTAVATVRPPASTRSPQDAESGAFIHTTSSVFYCYILCIPFTIAAGIFSWCTVVLSQICASNRKRKATASRTCPAGTSTARRAPARRSCMAAAEGTRTGSRRRKTASTGVDLRKSTGSVSEACVCSFFEVTHAALCRHLQPQQRHGSVQGRRRAVVLRR